MLYDLHIKNLAVVEAASIEFGSGFNVLSGETGAGKSIVVDSLTLLAGVRASTDMIRTGAETLAVTGVFVPRGTAWKEMLATAGIEGEGDEVVIRREVARNGRNRVFVNDRPVTLKLLADLAPHLLRVHGQREELGLVAPELQRTWVDRRGGAAADELLRRTAAAYETWHRLAHRLERLTGDDRVRQERVDLLRFQLLEIDEASLTAGEETSSRQEREVLRHAEAIQEGISRAATLLFEEDGAAYDAVARSRQALEQIADWEPQAAGWASELEEIDIRLGELETALGRRRDEVEADPQRLNALEDRLALIERLARKYGATTAEILERQDEIAAELDELESDESTIEELTAEVDAALGAYRQAAAALSAGRRAWADELARRASEHLAELALDKARFTVALERRRKAGSPLVIDGAETDFSELGYDHVVFLFSTNPGEELRSLARVASGGELSRLYLAVQLAARGDEDEPSGVSGSTFSSSGVSSSGATLVFDEVDSGISGAEAATLGGKLRRLAQGGQILAVTHLPQVASCGDLHFKVKKEVEGGRTRTAVEPLGERGRVEEVARMLAGSEVTELSLSHARELIAAGVSG